jgi:ribonuclease R
MALNGRNIHEQILGLLRRKDYRPLNRVDIARKLGLTGAEGVALRKSLRELERAGEIARIRKNRYVLPAEADLVTGKLSIHQAGYGFLTSEMSGQPDVFIAAENTGTAMHGDRVVARMSQDEPYGRIKGRREGRVIRILERAHDTIVGTLQRSRNFYYVVPDDPRIVHDVYVGQVSNLPQDKSATVDLPLATSKVAPQVGDKVVVRLEAWESRHVNPEGEIIEVLGPASAPGIDMLSIIRKYHLPTEFPRDVLEQAKGIPETIDARQLEGREDLRGEFIVTIDPDDARDFDDAIHVEKMASGWRLGSRSAPARKQRLPPGPCDTDVAGAIEQRRLQSQSRCRSVHTFRIHSFRQTRHCKRRALCAQRNSKRAPAYVQTGLRDFDRGPQRSVERTAAPCVATRYAIAAAAIRAWCPGPRFPGGKSLGR